MTRIVLHYSVILYIFSSAAPHILNFPRFLLFHYVYHKSKYFLPVSFSVYHISNIYKVTLLNTPKFKMLASLSIPPQSLELLF